MKKSLTREAATSSPESALPQRVDPVRLKIRGHLCQKLIPRHADVHRKPQFLSRFLPYRLRGLRCSPNSAVLSVISICLLSILYCSTSGVYPFKRRISASLDLLIEIIIRGNQYQLRALFQGRKHSLSCLDPACPGRNGLCQYNSVTPRHIASHRRGNRPQIQSAAQMLYPVDSFPGKETPNSTST